MGPCPFRHGYHGGLDINESQAAMLQWGHALSGMDTGTGGGDGRCVWLASMGPCPFRHGYPLLLAVANPTNSGFNGAMPFQAWILFVLEELQAGYICFNGAMPFQAWIRQQHAEPERQSQRFNGAMPFQAWIRLLIVFRNEFYNSRFNGAMPFQAWIQLSVPLPTALPTMLQWGHALSGMDTVVGDKYHPVQHYSFNGAMPFQAWIPVVNMAVSELPTMLQWGHALSGMDTSSWHLQSQIVGGFNGAMPFQAWIQCGRRWVGWILERFNGAMPFQAWIPKICFSQAA